MEWLMLCDMTFHPEFGFCFIDVHGDTYDRVLRFMAYSGIKRKIALFDLTNPTHILGLDILGQIENDPYAVEADTANAVSLIAKMTGNAMPNEMPSFQRVCSLVCHYCIETGTPLNHAYHIINMSHQSLRGREIGRIKNETRKAQWYNICANTKSQRDWFALFMSLENRLTAICASPIKRYLCSGKDFNFRTALDEGWIVLVKLAPSDHLHPRDARMFSTLSLHQFFLAAMSRKSTRPFTLYVDEAQTCITPDVGSMLDQARKRNLHVVLAHHHLEQEGFTDRAITESVMSNARMRFIFGDISYPTALRLVPEMFLDELNADEIKETRKIAAMVGLSEEKRAAVSTATREGDEWEGQTITTTTETTATVPQYEEQEVRLYRQLTEKHSRLAERLINQRRRHFVVKLLRRPAEALTTVFLPEIRISDEVLSRYLKWVYSSLNYQPVAALDEQIATSEAQYLKGQSHAATDEDDDDYDATPKARRGRKPADRA